ncbi:MAG TPA: hypothetical protein VGP99_03075, partial [Tepidisphaeraceae bacterium]|nr:hypothetical protein [Tepidisphaeraceae bacterium]
MDDVHRFRRHVAAESNDLVGLNYRQPIADGRTSFVQSRDGMPARVPRQRDAEFWRWVREGCCYGHEDQFAIGCYFFIRHNHNSRSKLGIAVSVLNPSKNDTAISKRGRRVQSG